MKKLLISAILALGLMGTMASAEVNLKSCIGCHGQNFEKSALGKSKIVADMNVTEINTAMVGYKDGTYGGPMKGIMKAQVAKLSYEEVSTFGELLKMRESGK